MDLKTIQTPESSNIASYGYSPPLNTLFVKFKSGASWKYEKVPPDLFEDMQKAESVGKFLSSRIKGYYDGQKIEG